MNDTFAIRLRFLRERAGLTQAALAERAGLRRLAVIRLEAGRTKPSLDTAERLARELGRRLRVFEGCISPRRET